MNTNQLNAVPKGTAGDNLDAAVMALRTVIKDILKKANLGNGVFLPLKESVQIMLYKLPDSEMTMMQAAAQIEQHTPLKVEIRHTSHLMAADQQTLRRNGIAV